jgi:predicted ATP-dependent serine protease
LPRNDGMADRLGRMTLTMVTIRLIPLVQGEVGWHWALADLRRTLGGEGRVLLISGEPGVGKTRFIREIMA